MTVPCSNPTDKLLVHCGTGQTTKCRPRDPLFVPVQRLKMVSWNIEWNLGCPGAIRFSEFVSSTQLRVIAQDRAADEAYA
jgi:hypothetical protein